VTVNSTMHIPFEAGVNTTIRDIRRMEHGEAFLKELANMIPGHSVDTDPQPGSLEYMHVHAIPEMVLRQMRLMGSMPNMSIEDIKKWLDEKLN